jgi:hypothetical protein
MERVGNALAAFAKRAENRLIVTSNLSNAGIITSLFGGPSDSEEEDRQRFSRLINLLVVAAPNTALEHDRDKYQKLLEQAVTGRGDE